MTRGRIRLEWDQTSALWQAIAEPNRDSEAHPEPYTRADVHPLLAAAKKKIDSASRSPNWAEIERIKANHKVSSLGSGRIKGNRSGEGISPAGD